MPKNRILTLALFLSRLAYGLCIAFYLGFLFVMVHSTFQPASYQLVEVSQAFRTGYGLNDIHFYFDAARAPADGIFLADLNSGMRLWLLIRGTAFFLLTFLIITYLIRILQSVQALKTFYEANIRHFRKIGWYALAGFVLSSFNFVLQGGTTSLRLDLAFGPLGVSLAAFILSEIFKEGKQLLDDQNSII